MQVGDVVAGKYRIEQTLGAGGMGVVVCASHLHLRQRVAIKFLLASVVSGPESVARFLREAQAAARIQSEHVARVFDAATLDDGTPYMVMEFLEGRDLAAVLKQRGPLGVEEAVGYVLEACEGIAEAHAVGIIHRDVKPSNFFVCERGGGRTVVKVLDFGVSKMSGGTSTQPDVSLTNSSALLGSPLYMSPEQMASAKDVDHRTDIWSLGVTLFELVAGLVPFGGESVTEVIANVLQRPPASLRDLRPSLPPEFIEVVGRSLAKERDARYQNVAELAAAIAPFGPRLSALSVERITDTLRAARIVAGSDADPLGKTSAAPSGPAPSGPPASQLARSSSPASPGDAVAAVSGRAPGMGASTAQPVSSDREESAARPSPRPARRGYVAAALAVLAVGAVGAAVSKMRPPKTPEALGPPSSAWPSAAPAAASSPAPSTAVSLSPPAPVPPATDEPTATASTRRPAPPVPLRPPVPAVAQPIKSAAPAAPLPVAPAPSCHVVQYFDSDGEPRFKKECP